MMTVEYDGETYQFDMEDATEGQLIKIKKTYGLHLLDLAKGMQSGDIDAMRCILWLMKQQQGNDLLRLETVTITKPVKFASALMVALLKEQQDLLAAAEKALAEGEKSAPKE